MVDENQLICLDYVDVPKLEGAVEIFMIVLLKGYICEKENSSLISLVSVCCLRSICFV